MSQYFEWPEFEAIYLEDSFVLGVDEAEDEIAFTVDCVLTEKSPLFINPKNGEQYCYKKG